MLRSLCQRLPSAHNRFFKAQLPSKRCLFVTTDSCARTIDEFGDGSDDELDNLFNDEEYLEIVPRNLRKTLNAQNIFVLQPRVRWGHERAELHKTTTPELQLEEGIALVETIDGWKVVGKSLVTTKSFKAKHLFGSGALEKLSATVASAHDVTAVVLGVDILTGYQQAELEDFLGHPVYDRYSVVLQIFNSHAKSKESRLQVALAEIPYVRSRLRELTDKGKDRATGTRGHIAGSGESFFALRRRLLEERSRKLTVS